MRNISTKHTVGTDKYTHTLVSTDAKIYEEVLKILHLNNRSDQIWERGSI